MHPGPHLKVKDPEEQDLCYSEQHLISSVGSLKQRAYEKTELKHSSLDGDPHRIDI